MNKIKINDLQSLKLEAEQNLVKLNEYITGKEFCNTVHEHTLIEKNKQCIINCDRLIKTLGNN